MFVNVDVEYRLKVAEASVLNYSKHGYECVEDEEIHLSTLIIT